MKFHLYEPMYRGHFYVFASDDKREVQEHINQRRLSVDCGELGDGKCAYLSGANGPDECLIVLHKKFALGLRKGDPEAWAVLAHECHHAAKYILDARGVEDTNEPRSYYITWLLEEIGKRLVKGRIR